MSIKNKLKQTKTTDDSVIFNDGPSGFERGLKLDRIVDFVKVNRNFLWLVKWEGHHQLDYVTYEDMKLNGSEEAFAYLENCLKEGSYDG